LNILKLFIITNTILENLNILENMVVSLFGNIKKKNVVIPFWKNPIYTENELKTKTCVVPIKNIQNVSINFLIPDRSQFYNIMVIIYIIHCSNNFLLNFPFIT